MSKSQNIFFISILLIGFQNCGLLSFWKTKEHEIRPSYYNDGSLEYESSYLNNKLDGPSYHYNVGGMLISYAEYVNGSPHGIWKIFYDSGKLKYACSYSNAHKDGEEKFYHENGQMQSLIKYEYGKVISDIIRWDENGELLY